MTITKKDIEKMAEVFVTKMEAKAFATKDDLKNLEGKMLNNFDMVMKKNGGHYY